MNVLAFPFRFNPDGTATKVEQGSEAHQAQCLAALIQTRPGELPLALDYGTPEATFDEFEPGLVAAASALYHPSIAIEDILVYVDQNGEISIDVIFGSSEVQV